MLEKVISGGQLGIEQLALIVAKQLGVPTGGRMPVGFWTGRDYDPSMQGKYQMEEGLSNSYRTSNSIIGSDGTVLFGDEKELRNQVSINMLRRHRKPHILNPSIEALAAFIRTQDIRVLNVTGTLEDNLTSNEAKQTIMVLAEAFKDILKDQSTSCKIAPPTQTL